MTKKSVRKTLSTTPKSWVADSTVNVLRAFFVGTISLKLLLVGQLLCDFFHVGTDLVIDVHIHGYITFSEVNM